MKNAKYQKGERPHETLFPTDNEIFGGSLWLNPAYPSEVLGLVPRLHPAAFTEPPSVTSPLSAPSAIPCPLRCEDGVGLGLTAASLCALRVRAEGNDVPPLQPFD
ncbi:MAG: hypothetical protein U0401_11265 [Anaerolineae bacterium]